MVTSRAYEQQQVELSSVACISFCLLFLTTSTPVLTIFSYHHHILRSMIRIETQPR